MKENSFLSLFFYVVILIAISCQSKKSIENIPKPERSTIISFATGGCFGECPFLAIEVDNTLQYRFYGGKYADKQGRYTGKISQALWDTIYKIFIPLIERNLDSKIKSVDDLSFECIIKSEQKGRHIQMQEMELPEDVRNDFKWMLDSYKRIFLNNDTDSFLFKTKIQSN